jgi:hypothetical protein
MTTMHFFGFILVFIELFLLHQFLDLGSYRYTNIGSQYILLLAWPASSSLDSLSSSSLGPTSIIVLDAPQPTGLLCNPKILHSAQIQQPCASNKEAEVPNLGCAYSFWFDNRIPKDIEVLTRRHLAATDNVLHCFSLLPAESASGIPPQTGPWCVGAFSQERVW